VTEASLPQQFVEFTPGYARGDGTVMTVPEMLEKIDKRANTFYLLKVSNKEHVARVGSRQEALDMIKKHVRQKKAKLYAVDINGDEVIFSEEEMA
jgi:uncharacterized protein YnzC (UPF0291/DUF896 family)